MNNETIAHPPNPKIKMGLAGWVLLAVLAGITMGMIFGTGPILFGFKNSHLGQLGILVIKMLRTLATPLILFAILDAFLHIKFSAKQGGRLLAICLGNVAVAMVIGVTLINLIHPGKYWQGKVEEMKQVIGAKPLESKKSDDPEAPETSLDPIKNISYYIPSSLVKPFIYNNVISIVLVALLIGTALRRVKERQMAEHKTAWQSVENFVGVIYESLVQILEWVVHLVPFAVFAVVAQVVGGAGIGVFKFLWIFLTVILLGLFLHSLIYYPAIAWLLGKKSPRVYLGKGADAILTGLSINSSLATVPVTLRCLNDMGVRPGPARLAACVGTNLNNDGITLYEAMTALFLAQALGMDMSLSQQLIVVISSIMAGAGIAGIPEAGLIVLPLVLGAAGIPEEMIATAIPLILPVDWIIARVRSGVNVMSDMLVAILLDAFES